MIKEPSLEHLASLYAKARIPSTKERRNIKLLDYNNLRKVARQIVTLAQVGKYGPANDGEASFGVNASNLYTWPDVFEHRKDISRRVLEPCDRRAVAAVNEPVIRL